MTDVTSAPEATTDAEMVSGVAQYLEPVVIDLNALALEGKQAHWHVRGRNFIGVHELLDTLVEHARDYGDNAAERIVALGLPLDARTKSIAKKTTVPPVRAGFAQTDDFIADVIAGIDAALVSLRAAIEGLEEIDPVSQDLAIAITADLEKDRWFLFSHIAEA
ncbi:Dps family protein [Yonghaparkia sp. Root332]|uniref:Dps family protein n=1 Tax=Yonghaparkia sp. Root332 TaxID=1736516 RepID=UPI0006FAE6D0|nr:DNA starvation/stationary phase protection protein [Yonghaparkia sp. Root332]KQV24690.1 DNA starvation/stationary phase protection protein [Yonghaparkia sp. Root332]